MKRALILILAGIFIFYPLTFSSAQEAQQSNRISLDIKGMDILDVLKILSMRSDLNIIAGKNVRGNVTMFLKDVDVWDAFEIILAANDLAYEKHGNIINVMPQRDYELLYGEKHKDRRIVKTIKLEYARVEDISAALSQIKTNIGKVVADEPSKSVVLMDIPSKVGEMEEVIKTLDTPVITKVYELQYAKVDEIKDKITEMLTKNIGSMRIDERTNKIAITDTERKMAGFDEVIVAFDEKHKEVEIEAVILELTLNDQYQMGVDWDLAFNELNKQKAYSRILGDHVFSFDFSKSLTTGFTDTAGKSGKGLVGVIQCLQKYGETKILSNPRLTVLNNEEAKILVGKNQPYVTTTVSQGETTSQTAANVTYIDLGVELSVTPTINNDGFITIKVKPKVSSSSTNLTYNIDENTSNTIPIVETSTTETTVMIKDNNTIMLSGLIQKRDEEETNKVPLLGDIPIVGNLFKNTTKGNTSEPERKEIIIFLTPRIVYGEERNLVEEVKEEREKKEQMRQAQKLVAKKLKEKPKIEKEIIIWNDGMKQSDYYKLIWQGVNERIAANRPERLIPGDVLVSFVVMSDGKLARRPTISALPDTDPALVQIALDSVEEAAPFPSFPSTIKKECETFNIDISYE